jgi:hypothetical protein
LKGVCYAQMKFTPITREGFQNFTWEERLLIYHRVILSRGLIQATRPVNGPTKVHPVLDQSLLAPSLVHDLTNEIPFSLDPAPPETGASKRKGEEERGLTL